MPNCFQPGRSVERSGDNARALQLKGLPKQAGSANTAKTALRYVGTLILNKPVVICDGDIYVARLRMWTEGTVQALAHCAVAVDYITQRPSYFVTHRTTKTATIGDLIFVCHFGESKFIRSNDSRECRASDTSEFDKRRALLVRIKIQPFLNVKRQTPNAESSNINDGTGTHENN